MPKFLITTEARADISERWVIEASNVNDAWRLFEECPDGQIAAALSDEVVGNEADREILSIEPYTEPAHYDGSGDPTTAVAMASLLTSARTLLATCELLTFVRKTAATRALPEHMAKLRAAIAKVEG